MDAHRHRWATVSFFVEAARPTLRQACACAAERSIPAWDRIWTPEPAARDAPMEEELFTELEALTARSFGVYAAKHAGS